MRKLYISAAALLAAVSLNAASLHIIEGDIDVGGYMPECISPSGKYVAGSTQPMAMFMAEWAIDDIFLVTVNDGSSFENFGAELRSVNDSGIAVGFDDNGAVMVDLTTREYKLLQPVNYSENIYDAIADAVTQDGEIVSGAVVDSHWAPTACYWENGERNTLPTPSESELGFKAEGSRALLMDSRGDVIVGYMVDRFNTHPMIIWKRGADGSYTCDPVCTKWFGDDKEFVWFEPKALSPDGKKVAMQLMYATESIDDPLFEKIFIGIYDIESEELTVVKPNGENGIEFGQTLNMFNHAISNNGFMVGWVLTDYGDRLAFIMDPKDLQPKLLSEVFPEIEKLLEYDSIGEHALSGISADGRYICGMGVKISGGIVAYEGYVLDTENPDAGVSMVKGDANGNDFVYNLNGLKIANGLEHLNGLDKGIFIHKGKKYRLK